MTQIRFAILIFGILVSLFPLASQARDLTTIKKSKVIRIAVDGATPGFNFFKRGKLAGFEVELAQELAKRLGLKAEWVVKPFNSLLIGLTEDRFDLIATSHAITPERQKVALFARPHYCTGAVVVSMHGGPRTAQDLVGKVIAVATGTVYYDFLKTIPGIKAVKTFPGESDGLQNLLSGFADAWVTERFVAVEAIRARRQDGLQIGEILIPQINSMVVSKNNHELKAALDQQLQFMLNDGSYAKLSKRWFASDIRCRGH